MDFFDLQRRVVHVLTAAPVIRTDGVPRLPGGSEEVRAALEAELAVQSDPVHLRNLNDLVQAIDQREKSLGASGQVSKVHDNPSLQDLAHAISLGDIVQVEAALATTDPDIRSGPEEATPLYQALSGSVVVLEVAERLLDAGADPREGRSDANVLHGLAFGGTDGLMPEELALLVKRCVDLGADLEQRSSILQWSPLMFAVAERNLVAVEALLLAGADLNARAGGVANAPGSRQATVFDLAQGHSETTAILDRFSESAFGQDSREHPGRPDA